MTEATRSISSDRPPRTRTRELATELLARIRARHYSDRLPAERLLAKEFNVPRHTVRDALDLLENNGTISRRPGSGSFVVPDAIEVDEQPGPAHHGAIAENTGPLELHVVRGIFEPELVRLAVIHMSPRDVERLRGIVERMERVQTDQEEFIQCEEDFFLQLARGTENPLLIAVFELITDVRRLAHWRTQRKKLLAPRQIRERQGRHRSMFNAIENRDIENAVEYARLLLVDEQRTLDI